MRGLLLPLLLLSSASAADFVSKTKTCSLDHKNTVEKFWHDLSGASFAANAVREAAEAISDFLTKMGDKGVDPGNSLSGEIDIEELEIETDKGVKKGSGALDFLDQFALADVARQIKEWLSFEEEPLELSGLHDVHVGHQIGSGGFKTVYNGRYHGRPVAIAIISTRSGGTYLTSREIANFNRELTIQEAIRAATINGISEMCRKYIPRVLGYHKRGHGSATRKLYMILDLAKGDIAAGDIFAANQWRGIGAALQITLGAMCVKEAGYVHKDIKPLNYLILMDDATVQTNDFGLTAALIGETAYLNSRSGTRRYMPTEVPGTSGEKYDVFAMGKTFKETGIVDHIGSSYVDRMQSSTWSHRPSLRSILAELHDIAIKPLDDLISAKNAEIASAERRLREALETVELRRGAIRQMRTQREKIRAAPVIEESFWDFLTMCGGERKKGYTASEKASEIDQLDRKISQRNRDKEEAKATVASTTGQVRDAKAAVARLRTARADIHERLRARRDVTGLISHLMSGRSIVSFVEGR
jgi:serine/threonine protein kinase